MLALVNKYVQGHDNGDIVSRVEVNGGPVGIEKEGIHWKLSSKM